MEEVEEPKQKNRGRKKNLYASIRKQMEFYFSPSNLAKEKMTSKLLQENGSIDLSTFLGFNKIRSLTTNVTDIVKALHHSSYLFVSDDLKVKPIASKQKENMEECTIYIEQIPPDATIEYLEEQFKIFGPIDYVSIPKYSNTKKCKGFAFVEFSKPEFAEKAIEEYKKCGGYLSMTDPKDLCSIAVYTKITEKEDEVIEKLEKRKRKSEEDDEEVPPKKAREESEKENDVEEETEDEVIKKPDGEETNEDTKKKKNRNKKKKVKKPKVTAENSGFQILSKADWRHLRNKYLNEQRVKTAILKKHLRQIKEKENGFKKSEKNVPGKSVISDEKSEIPKNSEEIKKTEKPAIQLVPGCIVKVTTSEPIVDRKQFKSEVNGVSSEVKYVDLKEGDTTVFVRLKTDEGAKKFCEDSPWQDVEILTGDEESEYLKKIEKDRFEKFNAPKPKQRGKDKLFKKAEKVLGKHLVFDNV